MYGRLFGWEWYLETVDTGQPLWQWKYDSDAYQVWLWKLHIVLNRVKP